MWNRSMAVGAFLTWGIVALSGCQTASNGVVNAAGRATQTVDMTRPGPVAGVGIESQDVVAMTDAMVRSMLGNPQIANRSTPPQVVIDDAYFINESSQRINKRMITTRLRTNLNRAANGRIVFVTRNYASAINTERRLKRDGTSDIGTTGLTAGIAGADYRLGGSIQSRDSRSRSSGTIQRWNLITFEMFDTERGTLIWSDDFEFERASQDDVIYR